MARHKISVESFIKVTSYVIEKGIGKETNETRWYISSLI
jgi:hypothetical protein